MSKFKVITHVFAVVGAAVVGFILSPAGQGVLHQYPILAPLAGVAGILAAIYHIPVKK